MIMSENKQRPGIMLYFDSIRPAINRFSDEQCGLLLRAIVDYAQYGTTQEMDQTTGIVFDLLVPKIDRDGEKYEETREQRKYAVYVRDAKKRGEVPMTFDEWRLTRKMAAGIEPMYADNGPYPSATVAASAAASPTPPATTPTSAAASGEGEAEGCKGGGEGEPMRLYAYWCRAMDAGDKAAALNLSSRLVCLGYNVDPVTRKLTRR